MGIEGVGALKDGAGGGAGAGGGGGGCGVDDDQHETSWFMSGLLNSCNPHRKCSKKQNSQE